MGEQKAQFAMWCMLASPLILGNDVRYMSSEIFDIFTNRDLIALNQDTLGHSADIVWQTPSTRSQQIFLKQLANTTSPRAVALFNRGDAAAKMSVRRSDLQLSEVAATEQASEALYPGGGIHGQSPCGCISLRDLETKLQVVARSCGAAEIYTVDVQAHQAVVLRVDCVGAVDGGLVEWV